MSITRVEACSEDLDTNGVGLPSFMGVQNFD
jgi:hypothetical protein